MSVVFEKSVNIDSASVTFDVDIVKDLGIQDAHWEYVQVEVVFTENFTKKQAEANAALTVVQFAYEAVFVGEPSFTSNKPYNFEISLRKFDGTSVRINS